MTGVEVSKEVIMEATLLNWVPAIVAVLALGLSVYNTVVQRREQAEKRKRRLRVKGQRVSLKGLEKGLEITVVNESQAEVTLSRLGIPNPEGYLYLLKRWGPDEEAPRLLPEGSKTYSFPWEDLGPIPSPDKDGWVRFTVFAVDALGNYYTGPVQYRVHVPPTNGEDR